MVSGEYSSLLNGHRLTLQQSHADKTITPATALLSDARRLIRAYRIPITSHALHVYHSAVVTMPQCPLATDLVSPSLTLPKMISPRQASWGNDVQVLEGHTSSVQSVAFSPDGRQVASGSGDMGIRIWDAKTGTELRVLQNHKGSVRSVAFSPDGKQVVSGSADKTVRIWDAQTGTELRVLLGHYSNVFSVAFSPVGKQVVSGSVDKTIRIWDAQMGAEVRVLQGHNGYVSSAAFSPDGKQVVSGSEDKTVRIWDAETGTEMRMLQGHNYPVHYVAFSCNGTRVLSREVYGKARAWDIPTTDPGHSHGYGSYPHESNVSFAVGDDSHAGIPQPSSDLSVPDHPVLSLDGQTGWVTVHSPMCKQELKLSWLPKERRGWTKASKHTLVVGAPSGAVTIMSFAKVIHAMHAAGGLQKA
jgi:WD40 repeat protein